MGTPAPAAAPATRLAALRERIAVWTNTRPVRADLVPAVALWVVAVTTQILLVVPAAAGIRRVPPVPVILLWAAVLTAPLALRRRLPLTVFAVSTANFAVFWAQGLPNEIASWAVLGVAVYSAAAWGHRRRGAALLTAVPVVFTVAAAVSAAGTGAAHLLAGLFFAYLPYVLACATGLVVRRSRDLRAALQDRTAELERERAGTAARAAAAERLRLARELHDIVAHHVALVSVQAGAARRLFDRRPEQARAAVAEVETAARAAMHDLETLLGLLRSADVRQDDEPGEPAPGLAELPDLVDGVRRAGLIVELTVEPADLTLPASVEVSLYRLVQESLTNVLRHAHATRASVLVARRPGAVEVDVIDDGLGESSHRTGGSGGGRGLPGMRERAAMHHGTLVAGPGPDGGFRVRAVLEVR